MVDIDNTLARSSLGIHPGHRAEWERRIALPIRPLSAAVRVLPDVAQLADVAIVSGRPDYVEPQTRRWLRRYFAEVKPVGLHLCPVGTEPKAHKAGVYRAYQRIYRGHICAIDDVRYEGPRHFFAAPRQWPALLDFLGAAQTPAEPAATQELSEQVADE